MKKKILFGAVVAAALLSMSCQDLGGIAWKGGIVGSGDGTTTYTVKQTNEKEDEVIRGLKQVGILQRAQGTCLITLKDQTTDSQDGVAGFATCFTKNNADPTADNYLTYNFLLVGIRNSYGAPQTYVSYYCNIKKDELNAKNFGTAYTDEATGRVKIRTKDKFDPNETKPYEIVIEDIPDEKVRNLNNISIKDKTLSVAIKFTGKTNGDIDIEWLKDVTINEQASNVTNATTIKGPLTVSGKMIGRDDKSKNGKLCTYANIYAKKTLNARWDICDISWSKEDANFFAEDDDLIDVGDIFFEEVK